MSAELEWPVIARVTSADATCLSKLAAGAIVTVEPGRIRIRPAAKKDADEEPTT